MSWFRGEVEQTEDPDITGLRYDPEHVPGMSPGRIGLLVFVGGCVLIAWLVMPLSSWVSGWWSGFGNRSAPLTQVATPQVDLKALDSLTPYHVSKPPVGPQEKTEPPVPELPDLSMYDDLKSQYDWLAQQYAALKAQLEGQASKGGEHAKPMTQIVPKKDESEQKYLEEEKRKREAFGKSEPIWMTRQKEDKVGQTHALKSPFSLAPSETIDCETTMQISSDTPGAFVAIVTRDIPDTATRMQNVIPHGSKFVFKPRGKLVYGDNRMEIQTQTLTFPGGSWLKMPTNTVTDQAGTSGFTGDIDRHTLRIFGSILITGVLRGGTTIATGGYAGGVGERIGGSVVQEGAAEGTRQARQFMRTDPTITVPAHYACQILLEDELVLTRSFGRMP